MSLPKVIVESESAQAETRRQLLEAAAEVFAQAGFRAATVREICQRAGANIAGVNYHFGDKERLYTEVLKFAFHRAYEKYPADFGLPPRPTMEQRLRTFVRSYLLRIFDDGPHAWHGKLMAREMIEPTRALDALVEDSIRPNARQLAMIVGELLGGKATEETVRLCGVSIVSQCLFYCHCRPVMTRLFPEQRYGAKEIEQLAEHITRFSLAALRQLAKATAVSPKRSRPIKKR